MAMTLRAARVNAGLTQKEVLEAFNSRSGKKLSHTTLISWEKNKTFPTIVQFQTLCEIYGTSIADIIVPEMQP